MVMNSTLRYLLKKIFKMIFTIWVVTTLIFVLIRLMPSNPVDRYIEEQMIIYGIGYEEATLRAQSLFSMELDEPILTQYLSFLKDVVHLDFGQSLLSPGVDVMSIIAASRTGASVFFYNRNSVGNSDGIQERQVV